MKRHTDFVLSNRRVRETHQALTPQMVRFTHPTAPQSLRAFTLVEMLVVITIIGILASMITAAAVIARRRARIAVVVMEVKQLEMACQAYKEKFGEYPPDFAGVDGSLDTDTTDYPIRAAVRNTILRHLARAFPRFQPGTWSDLQSTILRNWGVNINNYGPQGSLTFWLGGRPTWSGEIRTSQITGFDGFSANPQNPFGAEASRVRPFFDFDPNHINNANDVVRYYPSTTTDRNVNNPIVYFRAENGNYTYNGLAVTDVAGANIKRWGAATTSVVIPAADSRLSDPATFRYTWVNPRLFQIFCAGLDEVYTSPTGYNPPDEIAPLLFPSGDNYAPNTYDDITNFSNGTLEDQIP